MIRFHTAIARFGVFTSTTLINISRAHEASNVLSCSMWANSDWREFQ